MTRDPRGTEPAGTRTPRKRRGGRLVLGAVLALALAGCGDSKRPGGGMSFDIPAARVLAEGPDFFGLAVGDTDGDGHLDVVAASFDELVNLRGDGAGGLGEPIAAGRGRAFVALLGDLNGDGRDDLVASANDRGNVRVQLASGGGAFAEQILYGLSNVGLGAIALGDMNGDGALDIVGLTPSFQDGQGDEYAVSVLLNQGNGTFADAVTRPSVEPLDGLVVADFDGDGRSDVAAIEVTTSKVVLMRNEGNGVLHAPVAIAPEGTATSGITAGDVNGDGRIDLVALNAEATGLVTLRNAGGGVFSPPVPSPSPAAIAGLARIADFDEDGRDDVAALSISGSVLLWRGGAGALSAGDTYLAGGYAQGLQTGDVDGDGDADVLTINSTGVGMNLAVLSNDGTGRFQALRLDTESVGTTAMTVVDLDGDGRAEVIASASDALNRPSLVALGSPAAERRLTTRTRVTTTTPNYAPPAVGDLDGDNRPDVVFPDEPTGNVHVALANPDGSFAPPSLFAADVALRVKLADLNGDGLLDLVMESREASGAMSFMLGKGRGMFGPPSMAVLGQSTPRSFVIADFTRDGRPDVAAAMEDATYFGTIALLFNDGAGKFPANLSMTLSNMQINGLAAADFDRNGTMDVFATTGEEPGKGSVLFGAPNSQLFAQRSLLLKGMATAVVAADVDRDGWTDLIVSVPFLGGVELLMNDPDGRFSRRQFLRLGAEAVDLGTGDVDGDGHLDIVVQTSTGIVVLWNGG